ncbi:MAG: hypothetical protein ACK56I_36810, partial [bacterium]
MTTICGFRPGSTLGLGGGFAARSWSISRQARALPFLRARPLHLLPSPSPAPFSGPPGHPIRRSAPPPLLPRLLAVFR